MAYDSGVRLPVTAFVGNTRWAAFHVDLVGSNLRMTGEPEDVLPLAAVSMPDLRQHGYRVYPLVDHVADKVCAIFERHGVTDEPSTRYKDLVDLVAIVLARSVEALPQMAALRSEADRRGLRLPERLEVPDRARWEPGYAAEARRSLLRSARTLDEALAEGRWSSTGGSPRLTEPPASRPARTCSASKPSARSSPTSSWPR
jgi:hypothetical protein